MRFFSLLEEISSPQHTLYILGDLFDQWTRDSIDIPQHDKVIKKLKQACQQGLSIFLQTGNRDFMYGAAFQAATGVQYLEDKHRISLDHKKILLMHGDTLCTDDKSYQKARRLLRNPLSLWLFRVIPTTWLQAFTKRLRQRSSTDKKSKTSAIMDTNPQAVQSVLHSCDLLIHGHTHRPKVHQNRYVLGDWEHDCQILRYHNHDFTLLPYHGQSVLS